MHAHVRVPAGQRERLEHPCRYVARPAIASEPTCAFPLQAGPTRALLPARRMPQRFESVLLLALATVEYIGVERDRCVREFATVH